ncbi:MAG: hypothetical protein COB32_04045 [Halomonas sp.]|uniref:hypothetical protein n=1 Tax=Vreelandella aquamarina TaxID=77097 RepID=UPI000C117B71|nr:MULTISPECIES: hypothetical protein [Halomonas]MCD1650947.1 hypothetical protein [Halomonas axialensis]MCD2087125.1 hypothetical protein [Halomonas meridiana]PHR03856.1 MAG: hypothetical protein COB32_04045 [Halomonas sp.]
MSHETQVLPHNDLLNLAYYHKCVIEKKVAEDNREAIALDCMSCLIALAFSVEAIANFVGFKAIPEWNERAFYKDKMLVLGKGCGFKFEDSQEPYKSLHMLKTIRDQMAHGKPIETKTDVSDREALRHAMASPWDEHLTPEFAQHAFEQVKVFEKMLLELAGIPLIETLTSGTAVWVEA